MKWILLLAVLYAPLFAQPSSPILAIPQLAQEPVIDGNLSEWKEYAHNDGVWDMRRITQSPFYALDRGARNRLTIHGNEGSLQSDLSARYYLAWDETNFYFGAEVNDNVNDTEDPDPADKRWYFRDAICWFMEGPRDLASEWFGQGDNAFCFTASSEKLPRHAWWRHGASGKTYIEEPIPNVEWHVEFTGVKGNFVLEAKVEMASTVGQSDPNWRPAQVGHEYGVEIVHTDPDGGDYGGHFMIYGNGDDDITWGHAVLVGPQTPVGRLSQ